MVCGQVQDSQYYSLMEASRWLRHVARCLAFADDAARHLADNVTVVLQEGQSGGERVIPDTSGVAPIHIKSKAERRNILPENLQRSYVAFN